MATDRAPSGQAEGDTFPKLLLDNVRRRGARPAMRLKDRGIWITWTWAEMADEVMRFALGLEAMGVAPGDTVAIIGGNRPRLYWTFLAAQSLQAIPVPVYADAVAEEMAFVLDHADIAIAVCQDQEQVDKCLGESDRLPKLKNIIYDEPRGLRDYGHDHVKAFTNVQAMGDARLARDPALAERWQARIMAASGEDPSTILYTSGTTGQSKGVVLKAAGAVQAARDTAAFDHLRESDEVLAYLPLAWVGDHYLNYAQGLVAGFAMACPESPDTVQQDLREIGPSFYFAPPRVFESLLTRVLIRMEDAGALKRRMFHHFMAVAKRYGEAILDGEPVPLTGRLAYGLGEILVYGPLKNVLGFSRIRTAYTAGEAIGPDLFSFFRSLGINLKQLYGQTEAFLYITAQADGAVRSDTVGPAMTGVTLKLAENGEVLFKSPGMFIAYYKAPETTAEVMTEDGYIKTGDAGLFEPDGQLKIIDRAKDVGKLHGGALFAPKYLENKLKFFPEIREAVTYGHDRPFVVAMLNIDLVAVGNWAERNNISYASYQELAQHPRVAAILADHVAATNRALAEEPLMAGMQVHRFLVLHKELDADDGELTRTQKVRRSFVAERYAPLVDALYDGRSSCFIATEVTFEDGRKGLIEATVAIHDAKTEPVAVPQAAE
ncbi:AMP-dependent synthetase/ligase [Acuticoccus mangrovi]|uniref:AMP-binding protein n=1 Tax=Acuticoccus mangrovi TaxID=2796142 RepID=A0A934IM59_9HYPH|nr:AMP-binding protein [Acuticoccus mangrovi]MBJ3776372.1 AMP-binding protein [Acuticoccus mangrovi]